MSMETQWVAGSRKVWARAAMILLPALLPAGIALAQTPPFEEAKTLSTLVEPIERDFDIGQAGAGTYRITLTDLGAQIISPAPAPLAAAQLVVTQGQKVIATLDDKKDPTSPVDTVDFDATPGTYTVHVVGQPGTAAGSGPVAVKIAPVSATSTPVLDFADALSPPATTRTDLSTYQLELDVPADGDYQMALTDLEFPQTGMLDTASVFLFKPGAPTYVACLNIGPTPTPACPVTQTVTLTAGKYQLVAGGVLASGKDAALFNVSIKSAVSDAVVHNRTTALGAARRISDSSFQLDTGSYTLSLADLMFPAGLAEASALVVNGGKVMARASGSTPDAVFTVTADDTPHDVFAYAKADTTTGAPGAGSFDVEVKPASGASALSFITAMGGISGSPTAYTFPVDITTAGQYVLKFGDFQFPATLGASRVAVVQNGVVVGKTDAGTSSTLQLHAPLVAGSATVIVVVTPALKSGTLSQTGGTFGLEMALENAGAQNVLDVTQGVGGVVSVRKLTVTTAGLYDLTVTDLDAPDAFGDLMAVISRGSQSIGSVILGSGGSSEDGGTATLPDNDLAVGTYWITLIAQPGATLHAATYGLSVKASAPAPTVTLTAVPTTVTAGTAAGLTWSSTGATSCTASSNPSGLWSGTQALSGTGSSSPLTVETTFTLRCTDDNGRAAQKSVTVAVSAQSNNGGGGGGGAFDWLTLAALTLAGGVHLARRPRSARGAVGPR